MEITKDYYLEHQRLCAGGEQEPGAARNIPEREIEALCAELVGSYRSRENCIRRALSPARIRAFQRTAKRADAMARELLLNIAIRTERACLGCIELAGQTVILDESCSAEARESFAALFRDAGQVWMDSSEGLCKMRFLFRLYEEQG